MSLQIHTDVFSFSSYEAELAHIKAEMEAKIRAELLAEKEAKEREARRVEQERIHQEMEATKELSHMREEMERKIHVEMEAKIRQEMEAKIRQEMKDEAVRLELVKQQQMEKNMAVLPKLMDRIAKGVNGCRHSLMPIEKVMSSFLQTCEEDVIDIYLITTAIIQTNSPYGVNVTGYIIGRDGIYLVHMNFQPTQEASCGIPRPLYSFNKMLLSGSIHEAILVSMCQYPVNVFSHEHYSKTRWYNSAIQTIKSVISGIPGTQTAVEWPQDMSQY
jgi:hypothetical protein